MTISIETNSYPITRRFDISDTATEITIPRDATMISIGGTEKINYSFNGNDGDSFGDGVSDIQHFSFVPANNMCPISLETGRQSNRSIFVASETSSSKLFMVIEKSR
jgi:hypothetical protein